jgi:hypothetical protein
MRCFIRINVTTSERRCKRAESHLHNGLRGPLYAPIIL